MCINICPCVVGRIGFRYIKWEDTWSLVYLSDSEIWSADIRGGWSSRYTLKLAGPPAMLKQMGRRRLAWRFPNYSVCYMNHSRWCAVAAVLDYLCDGPCPSFKLTARGAPVNFSLQSSLQGCHLLGQDPLVPQPVPWKWSSRIGWLHLQHRGWRHQRSPPELGVLGRTGAPSMCCSH